MRHLKRAALSVLLVAGLLVPIPSALANTQISSMVDWNGLSLSANGGFSQVITPLSVPDASKARVGWALNVGNGTSRLSPGVTLSNRGTARFGFFFVSSDVRFKQSGGTSCRVSSPNAFGEAGTYQANCETPFIVKAGESYTVSIYPETEGNSNSWKADVSIKSTGEKVDLGVIVFSVESRVLSSSLAMDGFNQTSISGDGITCSNAPSADVIYSKPVPIGTSLAPSLVRTRASKDCPEFGFDQQAGGSVRVKLGNGNPVEITNPVNTDFHKGADYRLNFNPTKLDLNESLEMEFTPLAFDLGVKGGRGTFYGFDWCWQTKDSLKGELACGAFHVEAYGESGSGLAANADFFFQHGGGITKIDNETNCESRAPGKIAGVNSNYTTCWRPIVIQPNRTYVLTVSSTWRGPVYGSVGNWWMAKVTDKETGASVDVGYIKGVANLYELPLASMNIGFSYDGKPTACDRVPINDTIFSALRNGAGEKATLRSESYGNCAQVNVGRLRTDSTKFVVNHGGSNVKTRNASLFSSLPLIGGSGLVENVLTPSKPSTPKLSLLNVTGNELNLNVNIGSDPKPDNVYLVAPNLVTAIGERIVGKITGNNATWTLPIPPALSGKVIPFKVISSVKGVDSEPLDSEFQVPIINARSEITASPNAPKRVRSSFIGTDLLISAEVETSGKAAPNKGFLVAPALGITKAKPKVGELIGNKLVFTIPVSSRNLGRQYDYEVFTRNKIGDSKAVAGRAKIPNPNPGVSIPKPPSVGSTISCLKGSVLRTFVANSCPPGWKPG